MHLGRRAPGLYTLSRDLHGRSPRLMKLDLLSQTTSEDDGLKLTTARFFGCLCLSLYHALLSQSARLRLINFQPAELQNLIKSSFRKCKDLQSPGQISNSLKAGYEALDLLHSCSQRNPESISRLQSILQRTLDLKQQIHKQREIQGANHRPENRNIRALKKRADGRARRRPEALRSHPDTEPILSRPRLHVKGTRRVPVLVNARGVPFLRIKKPIPPSLSRAVRSILDWRSKKTDLRHDLEDYIYLANLEDQWDTMTGQSEEHWNTWVAVPKSTVYLNNKMIADDDRKREQIARKMWEVVLKERVLAEKEREDLRTKRLAQGAETSAPAADELKEEQAGSGSAEGGKGDTPIKTLPSHPDTAAETPGNNVPAAGEPKKRS
ncbi:hypothetical protein AJ79_00342 [Helicocarpus griseus UAMH5409]|uniref:Complex 1 LYR protein domain-containing protein n=1 Tax=Helicocarpus griseus UAMH5409 TaxID=1447875 RepID=A0A2B7YC06_9EURO|nr:hypothetical protein AJ79_00342 [Helicocarpus griseus UAMH5409]